MPDINRTKSKVLAKEPESIVIGGEEFSVHPLVIKECRRFRNEILEIVKRAGVAEGIGDLSGLLDLVQNFFDDDLVNLVKLAIPELENRKKEWLEENATEAELQDALGVAVAVNFPWLKKMLEMGQLGAILTKAKM